MFKTLLISGLVLFASMSASFAEAKKISSEGLDGLYATVTVQNWDIIREKLFTAYGGEIKEISFQELQDPSLKGANVVGFPTGEIFILAEETTPTAVLKVLAEVFPDFISEPLDIYNEGFAITMQKDGTAFALEATVYKGQEKSKSALGSGLIIKFSDDQKIVFPSGTKILLQSEQEQGATKIQSFSLTAPQSMEATVDFVESQLNDAGIEFQAMKNDQVGRFLFTVNGGPPSHITITQVDSAINSSAIAVWVTTEVN